MPTKTRGKKNAGANHLCRKTPGVICAGFEAGAARFGLSAREIQVLQSLCGGAAQKIAAAELGISVATVRVYVDRIRRKTGAENLISALWKIAKA